MTTKLQLQTKTISITSSLRQVVLFDCSCHNFDDVVVQLIKATGCSDSQAVQYAKIAEQFGCVAVFTGTVSKCSKVTTILTATGLNATVQ